MLPMRCAANALCRRCPNVTRPVPFAAVTGSAFDYMMVDKLKVPTEISAGEYVLSWRWDCEETPQVWNSCADLTVA